jgi:hypothetical protein
MLAQRLEGADLVLYPRERSERGDRRGDASRSDSVRLGREHGHLFLSGKEDVKVARASHLKRAIEPPERVETERGHDVDPTNVAGEASQAPLTWGKYLDVMSSAG